MVDHATEKRAPGVAASPIPILYTNWRGETAVRRIRIDFIAYGNEALGFSWGSNQWHPQPQMLLSALDVDKGERRTFALSGIKGWGEEAVRAALTTKGARDDVKCRCVSTFGPNPECGACGGSGCVSARGEDQGDLDRLRAALKRARNILSSMALEHTAGWRGIFARWPIHHEPLRNDARAILPIIDAALETEIARG